ncbi:30S ribosomal protein S17 [Candidatus Azambacteria bacterium RIFCSPHIGHO2_02_FULL_52_12]|uniref:Small ribosomal subunit protein uS17 n=1 Tax=Candidatus Azambacteria bacterium RIFCSPLOWO2_01_FULL_46_25 TaxID=1797298 RepID=A0A1F5BU49_9BACT|nr:MAG: 30S ribosomal protein S17 [Candidatus Azambacteria bacterium RIFCSPHIGHO2_02_FULL_52_12]OGD34134.1 MAG: 30S ribosomal protein S17 [Candidatus Azambacteria bacterium RIFCSPLOWO2_01_FULL_46_25]OGD36733.1 MAG: 30S ribosomal protein S17 [Candidatus Azambacteria bacterium RIFCSPHIGHO2_01_FULL_51_74]
MTTSQTKKRILEGKVVSDKMDKTVVVAVTTTKRHPMYQKFYHTTKRYKAHDEKNEYAVGDEVRIAEVRPLSKEKRWNVVEKISGAKENTTV